MSSFETQPHPWIRFFAKSVDLLLAATLLWALGILGCYLEVINLEVALAITVFFNSPLTVLFDTILLPYWGTTPGRRVFGYAVREADASFLSARSALRRSLNSWIRGLGCGIPVVSLISQYLAYRELVTDGVAAWDMESDVLRFRVQHKRVSGARYAVAAFIYFFVNFVAILEFGAAAIVDKNVRDAKLAGKVVVPPAIAEFDDSAPRENASDPSKAKWDPFAMAIDNPAGNSKEKTK
ncbi:RDD family protein [bacterium]|nr:RDD family protein [bacterium]